MLYCAINGEIIASSEAKISIHDRGLKFGDSIFETISIYNYTPYLFEYHLERLKQGLEAMKIQADIKEIAAMALLLLEKNAQNSGILRIMVTRGEKSLGYLPLESKANIIITEEAPRSSPAIAEASLMISSYQKISPSSQPISYKLGNSLNYVLAKMEAVENHFYDAILLDNKGIVAETSSANIFMVKGGKIYTPPLATGPIAGVIRRRLMEISPIQIQEQEFDIRELATADEIFITNSSILIIPVKIVSFSEKKFAKIIAEHLRKLIDDDIRSFQHSKNCS